MSNSTPRFLRDSHLFIAVLGALLVWAGMWLAEMSAAPFAWALQFPVAFAANVLLYPVLEELVFRGLIQGALVSRAGFASSCCGISAANVATSVVFVSLHFLTHAPLWALSVIVPSLVFGYFRDRYQSVSPSVVLHCFYNAGYFMFFVKV